MSESRHFLLVVMVTVVWLQAVCLVSSSEAFSMIRKYEPLDYPSAEQLKDLIEYEYSEDPLEPAPAKRQPNQGGTCTCTCETRPVNEEPKPRPHTPYSEAGSFLRTGVGMRPQSAARVIERTQSPKPPEGVNQKAAGDNGDHHSKVAKGHPWDYYGSSSNSEPARDEQQKEKPAQPEAEVKTTQAPEAAEAQSDQLDAWGHNRRFPWKHLPNTMCFRETCSSDKDCCMRYNLCDKSAKVCVDCWHGSICKSEQDCCQRFPYCKRPNKAPVQGGTRVEDLPNGKCVSKV